MQMFQWSKQRLSGTAGATFLLHVSVTATYSKHLHITIKARHQGALGLRFRKNHKWCSKGSLQELSKYMLSFDQEAFLGKH